MNKEGKIDNINILKYKDKLGRKAGQFIGYIAKYGIYGRRGLIKNYMIKVEIWIGSKFYGHFLIYYKPRENNYKVVGNELNDWNMQRNLLMLWDCMNRSYDSLVIPIFYPIEYIRSLRGL